MESALGAAISRPCGFSHYLGSVLWEGWVPLIRPGLRPVHLPRWGRLPPAGEGDLRRGKATSGGGRRPPAGDEGR